MMYDYPKESRIIVFSQVLKCFNFNMSKEVTGRHLVRHNDRCFHNFGCLLNFIP
jgi:hypothetical protein